MVIGNGLIASVFASFSSEDDILIFASGVSNSKELDENAFNREKELLSNVSNKRRYLVYFSTTGIFDPDRKKSRYIQHKLEMEEMINTLFNQRVIFRLPNIVGIGGNPMTMFNFFRNAILNNHELVLKAHTTRHILGVDELRFTISEAIHRKRFKNEIVNVCPPENYKVTEIVECMETFLGIKARKNILDEGSSYVVPNSQYLKLTQELGFNEFHDDYLHRLVKKYCTTS